MNLGLETSFVPFSERGSYVQRFFLNSRTSPSVRIYFGNVREGGEGGLECTLSMAGYRLKDFIETVINRNQKSSHLAKMRIAVLPALSMFRAP